MPEPLDVRVTSPCASRQNPGLRSLHEALGNNNRVGSPSPHGSCVSCDQMEHQHKRIGFIASMQERTQRRLQRKPSYRPNLSSLLNPVKLFLYGWNVILILSGFAIMLLTMYFLYYQRDTWAIPSLVYYVSGYVGLALSLISMIGLYGLHRQRACITQNQRNYPLAFFILFSFAGSLVIILGGIVALTLLEVITNAQALEFGQKQVQTLEKAIITNLDTFATNNPSGWKSIQNDLYCCGYNNPYTYEQSHFDQDLIDKIQAINNVSGSYCARKQSECYANEKLPCPAKGKNWCHEEFISRAMGNFMITGIFSLVIGGCQILSTLFSIYILLCDVRMMRSPAVEIDGIKLHGIGNNNH